MKETMKIPRKFWNANNSFFNKRWMFCDIAVINQIDNILFAFVWVGAGIFFFLDVCKDRNTE